MCRDKPDSSMPLIKFACKLAETATESRNTAGVETQAMRPEEDEQELVRFCCRFYSHAGKDKTT